jgi:hypothetical protein
MIAPALTNNSDVIVRLDRTIQYAAAVVGISAQVNTGCPAFAGHDNQNQLSLSVSLGRDRPTLS